MCQKMCQKLNVSENLSEFEHIFEKSEFASVRIKPRFRICQNLLVLPPAFLFFCLFPRVDLRETHDICSVDPPGCTDIDDALHCRKMPNGNYDVGVHIADVSHFIR